MIFLSNSICPQSIELELLPKKKFYQRYYADAIAHQFSLAKHFESSQWFGNIGGYLPVANVSLSNHTFQISAAATVFNTVIKTPGHIQVFTVDYLVDFFIDKEFSNLLTFRFIYGHLSAHFSDDGITQLNFIPISYVRDYIGVHSTQNIPYIKGKLYEGIFYNYHNEPVTNRHFTFQFGGDAGIKLVKDITAYFAIDIKIKSEVNYGTTQSYQAGLKYPDNNDIAIRIAFTHRRGFEERGQLFNYKDIKNTFGIFIDF